MPYTGGLRGNYHMRKVTNAEIMPGWWNSLRHNRDWFVTLSCGHETIRRASKAPKRILCIGCPKGSK